MTRMEQAYLLLERCGGRIGLDLPYFVKNGFWVIIRQIVGALSGLFVSVALAHLASQKEFGQYQFVFSVFAILSVLAIPGFNTALLQSVSKGNDGDYPVVVKKSFLWSFLGVPILAIIGGYYMRFLDRDVGYTFLLSSVLFPFFYSLNFWDGFFQAKRMFRLSAIFAMSQSVLSSSFLIGIVYFSHVSFPGMVLAYMSAYSFFNVLFIRKGFSFVASEKKDTSTVPFGFFLNRLSILGIISANLDRIIVGAFISMEQLSIYAVGTLFVTQIFELTKAILSTATPKIANDTKISKRNYLLIGFISACTIPFLILGFWFILRYFYPSAFFGALRLFVVGISFLPFFSLSVLYNFQIIFSRDKKAIAWSSVMFHSIKIALIPVLAVAFGVEGLAFLLGSQYALFLVVTFLTKKYFGRSGDHGGVVVV